MITSSKRERTVAAWRGRDHIEKLLDQALADSFPASDPVALDFEAQRSARRERKRSSTTPPLGRASDCDAIAVSLLDDCDRIRHRSAGI